MLKITGGIHKGRSIHAPPGKSTRPTQARLRQALANSLQTAIPGARVLDLFAGSGALGFEAISRGAGSVVFVERDRSVGKLIQKNATLLGVESQVTLIQEPVEKVVSDLKKGAPFDLIVADPPYEEGWELRILHEFPFAHLLNESGLFCLEWGARKSLTQELPDRIGFLVKIREKNYGDCILSTFQRSL